MDRQQLKELQRLHLNALEVINKELQECENVVSAGVSTLAPTKGQKIKLATANKRLQHYNKKAAAVTAAHDGRK